MHNNKKKLCLIYRWYFGKIDRHMAEAYLKHPEYDNGTFLVRKSDRIGGGYVISVKYRDEDDVYFRYIHHRIVKDEETSKFYLANKNNTGAKR